MISHWFFGALGACFLALPVAAAPKVLQLTLTSVSERQSYGLYLAAGRDMPCAFVRYQISGARGRVQSVALRPGQATVVALGQGWPPGEQALELRAMGCPHLPSTARRVRLHAASPDHAARASLENGLADVKADALRQRQG